MKLFTILFALFALTLASAQADQLTSEVIRGLDYTEEVDCPDWVYEQNADLANFPSIRCAEVFGGFDYLTFRVSYIIDRTSVPAVQSDFTHYDSSSVNAVELPSSGEEMIFNAVSLGDMSQLLIIYAR